MKSKRDVRIVVVGAARVGKTALLKKMIHAPFQAQYKTTTEVQFQTRRQKVENITLNLKFFELAGEERYENFFQPQNINKNFFLFMFDLNNVDSYNTAKRLFETTFKDSDNKKSQCIFLGNKSDLTRKITAQQIKNYCTTNGIQYRQMNCKDENMKVIDEICEIIANTYFRLYKSLILIQYQKEQATTSKSMKIVKLVIFLMILFALWWFYSNNSSQL